MPTAKNLFASHLNEYFIETGSYLGDGIAEAISAGFPNIISIELADKYFDHCTARFADQPHVKIIKGDSFKKLPHILKDIVSPITFWLDGHHSCGDTGLGEYWTPLIHELKAIGKHSIAGHTILIDDMRCWEHPNVVHGFSAPDILEALKKINSSYNISYEDGRAGGNILKNDILVAQP